MRKLIPVCLFSLLVILSCTNKSKEPVYKRWEKLKVTATAYNSLAYQTSKIDPTIAAWGDKLKPGMNAIAVSRDLLKKGLTHNALVKIVGFDGYFLVKDKMHYRWKNKIDIYMGKDVKKARKWGKQEVEIYYQTPKVEDPLELGVE